MPVQKLNANVGYSRDHDGACIAKGRAVFAKTIRSPCDWFQAQIVFFDSGHVFGEAQSRKYYDPKFDEALVWDFEAELGPEVTNCDHTEIQNTINGWCEE